MQSDILGDGKIFYSLVRHHTHSQVLVYYLFLFVGGFFTGWHNLSFKVSGFVCMLSNPLCQMGCQFILFKALWPATRQEMKGGWNGTYNTIPEQQWLTNRFWSNICIGLLITNNLLIVKSFQSISLFKTQSFHCLNNSGWMEEFFYSAVQFSQKWSLQVSLYKQITGIIYFLPQQVISADALITVNCHVKNFARVKVCIA